jgi:hypothetical protein
MFKNFKNVGLGLAVGLMTAAGSASAAIDVTAAVSSITEGVAAVGAIGGAILAVWGVRKVYSLIAR